MTSARIHPADLPGTSVPRQREAHYLRTTLAISGAVFVGFLFTYFGPMLDGTYPKAAAVVHLHGWSFFAWYLLFPLQAALIHRRRGKVHRRLGAASLLLAGVMCATGLIVISVRMADAAASAAPSFWSLFGLQVFATLLLFAGFYLAAIRFRRQAPYHKRLMVIASSAGMGAAGFRIMVMAFGQVSWAVPVGILSTNLFILGGMLYDRLREGRIHPAYRVGLSVCVAVEVAFILITPTPVGRVIADGLAALGGLFGTLY